MDIGTPVGPIIQPPPDADDASQHIVPSENRALQLITLPMTPSTRPQQPVLSRLISGKTKIGWGTLPVNVLHHVISFALEDVALDRSLHTKWGQNPFTEEIARGLVSRIRMTQLRWVCHGWRLAVDCHRFWPAYTILLDPSRAHLSTVQDYRTATLNPSTPSFPTLFLRARHTTIRVCLACRLNHPHRLGLYPAVRRGLTYTSKFSYAPTCDRHIGHFCSGCMQEHGISTESPSYTGSRAHRLQHEEHTSGLIITTPGDVDEIRLSRSGFALVCADCRELAVLAAIHRLMVESARQGHLRAPSESQWTSNEHVQRYIDTGIATATHHAYLAVEQHWLRSHTRYDELYDTARELQRHEAMLKREFLMGRTREDDRSKRQRLIKQAELKGEDWNGIQRPEDIMEMRILYAKWSSELSTEGELDDEDDVPDEYGDLNDKYYRKLKHGCLNDFFNDRVRFGFWVSPADEVRKIVAKDQGLALLGRSQIHTTFQGLADNAQHPLSLFIDSDYDPLEALKDHAGLINVSDHHGESRSLPPDQLLLRLDRLYSERLGSHIQDALLRLALKAQDRFKDDDEAETWCAGLPIPRLLRELSDWRLWVPVRIIEQVEMPRIISGRTGPLRPSYASELDEDPPRSPLFEVIEEPIATAVSDFGIEEVFVTPNPSEGFSSPNGQHRSADEDSPSLGKRKMPTEPAGGSHSSDKRRRSSVTDATQDDGPTASRPVAAPTCDRNSGVSPTSAPSVALGTAGDKERLDPCSVVEVTGDQQADSRHRRFSSEGSVRTGGSSIPLTPDTDSCAIVGTDPLLMDGPLDVVRVDGSRENNLVNDSIGSASPVIGKDETSESRARSAGENFNDRGETIKTNSVEPSTQTGVTAGTHDLSCIKHSKAPETPDAVEHPESCSSISVSNASSPVEHHPLLMSYAMSHRIRIPYIPLPPDDSFHSWTLGPGTERVLTELWYNARESLRECHCTICERARRRSWMV
ncbi:hypothetical protein IAU60_003710 [Kwoniella sp. DSM 27419]